MDGEAKGRKRSIGERGSAKALRRRVIDAINGALVDRARASGVPCPVNQLLTHLVRSAESTPRTEKTPS